MKKLLLLFILFTGLLGARSLQPGHYGTWTTGGTKPVVLKLQAGGIYRWDKTEGRYQIMDGHIWLLEKTRTGTKWKMDLAGDALTLSRPEDFKYIGGKGYVYFQMTNPALAHAFTRVLPKD